MFQDWRDFGCDWVRMWGKESEGWGRLDSKYSYVFYVYYLPTIHSCLRQLIFSSYKSLIYHFYKSLIITTIRLIIMSENRNCRNVSKNFFWLVLLIVSIHFLFQEKWMKCTVKNSFEYIVHPPSVKAYTTIWFPAYRRNWAGCEGADAPPPFDKLLKALMLV